MPNSSTSPKRVASLRMPLLAACLWVLCCYSTSLFAQTLTSDLPDYYPGQLATLTGTGFQPGETVTLQVIHIEVNGDNDTSPAHQPWTVVADASGNFVATWQVPADQDELGATLHATADGLVSGIHAEVTFTDNISANLDQVRNGGSGSPVSPGAWVNGNVNATQAHMVEGYSIPYRMRCNGLTAGSTYTLDIEWDTRHSSKNAIDYITQYDRLEPHITQWGHNAEAIDPLIGTGLVSPPTSTYAIPAPTATASGVGGNPQPQTSIAGLPAGEKVMTIYNGTITNMYYVHEDAVTLADASTRIRIVFTAAGSQVVLAWGGHISKSSDWGAGTSAGSLSGSPYHMRLKGFCIGVTPVGSTCDDGGNQDRALAASAVVPPNCHITGDSLTCVGSTLQFCSEFHGTGFGYNWFVVDTAANTAGVSLNIPTTDSCVTGTYQQNGKFRLGLTLTLNGESSTCTVPVTINGLSLNIITAGGAFVCQGAVKVFSVSPSGGSGNVTYSWSGPNGFTSTNPSITVTDANAGLYCVTVTDNVTHCSKDTCFSVALLIPVCDINGDSILCNGGSTTLTEAANGGNGTNYVWTPGNLSGSSITVSPTANTTYTVSFVDPNGCSASCSYPVSVSSTLNCSITGDQSVCQGGSKQFCAADGMASYLWSTGATSQCITVNASGNYSVTITNSNGCSSSCSRSFMVKPTSTSTTNVAYCQAALPITWNGQTVTGAGSYTAHLTNSVGCDSAATLVVTIKPTSSSTTNSSVCGVAYPFIWNGLSITGPGSYTAHLTNSFGCDSAATLVVTTKPTSTSTTNAAYCLASLPITWNGITVNGAGSYTAHFTNSVGCDSAATLVVTIKPTSTSSSNAAYCQAALPIQWNGITVNGAGSYTAHFTNSVGCDSAATLVVTVKPTSSSTTNSAVCAVAYPFVWNGVSITGPGSYTAHLTNSVGCDSAATLVVTTKPTSTSTTNAAYCQASLPIVWNGISVTGAGSFTVHLTNSVGCDSAATLVATIKPTSTSTTNAAYCQASLPITWNGVTVNGAGSYTAHLTNSVGCDSAATLVVTVKTPPACSITGEQAVCGSGSRTFAATAGMASYLWSTGATTSSISVSNTGNYCVTVTNAGGCSTSCCRQFTVNPLPTCGITGEQTVCAGGSRTFTASAGMSSYLWSTGATTQSINVPTAGTYYVTITNANGCTSSCSRSLTVNPAPTCALVAPSILPVSGTSNNTLSVTSNGTSRVWSVSSADNSWMIIGSNTGTSITYKAGTAGTTGTLTVVSTSSAGCTSSCSVTFGNMIGEYCTKTQGYYGNQGGKTCDNKTTTQAITQALSTGSIVIGDGTRKLTILSTEVSCLITKMPAGTTPAVLPVGNVTCATATGSAYLNNGKFISVLVGQTLAMSLNIRLNPALANVAITNRYLTTYAASSCTNGNAVAGSKQVFSIPQSILTYLGTNNKVSDLVTLANKALGMTYVPSGTQPTLSDITAALDALNRGFDGCRILAGFSANSSGLKLDDDVDNAESTVSNITLSAYPNPFTGVTTVQFELNEQMDVVLEVYSVTGQRVASLYSGVAYADQLYSMTFDASNLAPGMYLCKLSTPNNAVLHKVILMK